MIRKDCKHISQWMQFPLHAMWSAIVTCLEMKTSLSENEKNKKGADKSFPSASSLFCDDIFIHQSLDLQWLNFETHLKFRGWGINSQSIPRKGKIHNNRVWKQSTARWQNMICNILSENAKTHTLLIKVKDLF